MEAISDLQLRFLRKFRAFPPTEGPLASTEHGRKLVAISSRYGFALVAGPDNRLISVKTTDLHGLQRSDDFKEFDGFPKREIDFFNLQAEIFSIEFNSDGRVLAISANTSNGPFVYMFDGFTFHPTYQQQPFPLTSIRLATNNNAKMTAFEWNPCIPETFAASTTDQLATIQYSLNNPSSFSVVGNQTFKAIVTCISWSPKGKQITVGALDGKVYQLKPELAPVRVIDPPPTLAGLGVAPYRCVGICWLSTTEWAVVHSSTTNYMNLSILTVKKNQNPSWEPWPGVLPPLSDTSLPRSVNFLPLFDWQMVLGTSTCLTNAITFGSNGTIWKPWELTEPYIISTPLSSQNKNTYIIGAGYDFSSTLPVTIAKDGSKVSPQPIVYVFTSDGVLLLYHVTSLSSNRPSLVKPIEPCSIVATKNGNPPAGYQPRPTANNTTAATTINQAQAPPPSGLFGASSSSTTTASNLFGSKQPMTTNTTTNLFGNTSSTTTSTPIFGDSNNKINFKSETQPPPAPLVEDTVAKKKEEEDEKAKKEASQELAKRAEEQEKNLRVAEEEQKRRIAENEAAAVAERNRKIAEEEIKKKHQQQMAALEGNFKANLELLVSKLNEYARCVNVLRSHKMKLLESVKFQVEYDGHLEPMLKSMGYIGIIGNDIAESLSRLRQVTNSIQRSAKESQQCLKKGNAELPTPEWVLELSDDIDELQQREFTVVEKLQRAEDKMAKIEKMLKEGKAKIHQRNVLTPEQQQKLDKDSKTIMIFVRKLWDRIKLLRQQVRALDCDQKIVQTKFAIKSAGGEPNDSILDQSDVYFDASANTSLLATELMASMSIVGNEKKMQELSPANQSKNISKLLRHLESSSFQPKNVIQVVPVNSIVSQQKPVQAKYESPALKPKVAEAQKALIENLMKAQSPRSMVQKIPPQQVVQPIPFTVNAQKESEVKVKKESEEQEKLRRAVEEDAAEKARKAVEEARKAAEEARKAAVEEEQRKAAEAAAAEEKKKKDAEAEQKRKETEEAAAEQAKKAAEEEEQRKATEAAAAEEKKKKEAEDEQKRKEAEESAAEQAKKAAEAKVVVSEDIDITEEQPKICAPSLNKSMVNFSFGQPTTSAPPPTTNPFGTGFSGFANKPNDQPAPSTPQQNNPFSKPTSAFGSGTPAFGQATSSPFASTPSTPQTTGSAFGGGFSGFGTKTGFGNLNQQAPPTPQQSNPFGQTSAFNGSSSAFGGGNSAFGKAAAKSPFAANSSTSQPTPTNAFRSGGSFSAFANQQAASPPQPNNPFGASTTGSTFGSTTAFGGGSSAFGGGSSAFGGGSSAFGGGSSAFGQASQSPFASNTSNTQQPAGSTFGGFSAFANKSGGFGALAQQATATPQQNNPFGGGGNPSTTGSTFGSNTNAAFSAWRS